MNHIAMPVRPKNSLRPIRPFTSTVFALCLLVAGLPVGCGKKSESEPIKTSTLARPSHSIEPVAGIILGETNQESGLRLVAWPDGRTMPARVGEKDCRGLTMTRDGIAFIYFNLDREFKVAGPRPMKVQVEYFAAGPARFGIDFDSERESYSHSETITVLQPSSQWTGAEFHLADPKFSGAQNGGADFRLWTRDPQLFIRSVRVVPDEPATDYTRDRSVSITLGSTNLEAGLKLISGGDSRTEAVTMGNQECHQLATRSESYIYFAIDPVFKRGHGTNVMVQVEFFSSLRGSYDIQFDSWSEDRPDRGIFQDTTTGVSFDPSPTWNTAVLEIKNGRFENRQGNGADFRLRVLCREFYVRRVVMTGMGQPVVISASDAGPPRRPPKEAPVTVRPVRSPPPNQ